MNDGDDDDDDVDADAVDDDIQLVVGHALNDFAQSAVFSSYCAKWGRRVHCSELSEGGRPLDPPPGMANCELRIELPS